MPDTNLHPTFAAILAAVAPPVTVERCDGYMVISKMLRHSSVKPPYSYQYDADHYDSLEEAEEHFNDLAAGEYSNWQAVAIVPCRKGIPLGAKVLP